VKIQAQIEALENLADLDAELKSLDEELSQERDALGQKRSSISSLDDRLERSATSIGEMEKSRNELHQEARQMSLQMERSREKLARCRTEREVNAAQREIEELRKLYRDREQEIEKLTSLVDQARGDMEAAQSERQSIAGELGSREGEVASHLGSLETETGKRREARKSLVEKVQPVLYRRYELIRKRRGSAIAHVTPPDGTCSACHMRLPPMAFQQLMRGDDFQQCPSCNRIIYYRAAEESAESQSSGP
jgi:predicted  nucleic acid-binding Zn-ribbon protein